MNHDECASVFLVINLYAFYALQTDISSQSTSAV